MAPPYNRGVVNLQSWLQRQPNWMKDAACAARQDLPWVGVSTETSETAPTVSQQREMAQVCADCPILYDCARYALDTKGVGGFYAGIWLPWPLQGGGPRARRTLRKQFAKA